MFIKLTDTQLVILSAAAQREDRCLVATPTLKGGAAQRVAKKLISSGLVKEVKAKTDDPVWRRDEELGASYALKLTAAGAKAIVADEDVEPENADNEGGAPENHSQPAVPSEMAVQVAPSAEAMEPVAAGPSAPRSGSKLARVIELLQRDHGATIDELIDVTDWLAHTTGAWEKLREQDSERQSRFRPVGVETLRRDELGRRARSQHELLPLFKAGQRPRLPSSTLLTCGASRSSVGR